MFSTHGEHMLRGAIWSLMPIILALVVLLVLTRISEMELVRGITAETERNDRSKMVVIVGGDITGKEK